MKPPTLQQLLVDTSWGQLRIVGGSRAGEGTLVLLPQLQLALDPGRPHRALPPMRTVVISHGHLDHVGGLGYWASQRYLNSMPAGDVIAPAALQDDIRDYLAVCARLEGGDPYDVTVVPVADGVRHDLRRDVALEHFATDHWVPTLGTRVLWRKHRLRRELGRCSQEEIVRLRREGTTVSEAVEIPLLSFCADSGPGLLDAPGAALDAEVVILECSFFSPGDRERAARYGHTHLEDLRPHLADLECRHLILIHASRRHRLREVEAYLAAEVRPLFRGELHHLNVDWD